MTRALLLSASLLTLAGCAAAQSSTSDTAEFPRAEWNAPQEPFTLFGNVHYVGTHGLSALLLATPQGHILVDAGLPESAAPIAASIRALGFDLRDIRLIVNSHMHFDHAGGIGELQRLSGAAVAASPASAEVLERGTSGPDDPQYGILPPIARVRQVRRVGDGDTLRVGSMVITARFTPGHTPGSTSWSWRSCEGERCLDFVYADSQTPVSADGFLYSRSGGAVEGFGRGHALLERLPCDVIITPHPAASRFWERVEAHRRGEARALGDGEGCRQYAATARDALAQRLRREGVEGQQ